MSDPREQSEMTDAVLGSESPLEFPSSPTPADGEDRQQAYQSKIQALHRHAVKLAQRLEQDGNIRVRAPTANRSASKPASGLSSGNLSSTSIPPQDDATPAARMDPRNEQRAQSRETSPVPVTSKSSLTSQDRTHDLAR